MHCTYCRLLHSVRTWIVILYSVHVFVGDLIKQQTCMKCVTVVVFLTSTYMYMYYPECCEDGIGLVCYIYLCTGNLHVYIAASGQVTTCEGVKEYLLLRNLQHSPLQGSCCPVWAVQHIICACLISHAQWGVFLFSFNSNMLFPLTEHLNLCHQYPASHSSSSMMSVSLLYPKRLASAWQDSRFIRNSLHCI